MTGPIIIRKECAGDEPAIRTVLVSAFSRDAEADIVDRLRVSCPDALSLVALAGDRPVGHVLFSPVTIEAAQRSIAGAGLAPLAVLPSLQKQGIGARLVTSGLDHLRRQARPSSSCSDSRRTIAGSVSSRRRASGLPAPSPTSPTRRS